VPRLAIKTYVNTHLDRFPGMSDSVESQLESILTRLNFVPENPVIQLCGDNMCYLYKRSDFENLKMRLKQIFGQYVNFYIESFIPYEPQIKRILSYDPSIYIAFSSNAYSSYISNDMAHLIRQQKIKYSCYSILGRQNLQENYKGPAKHLTTGFTDYDLDARLKYFARLCHDTGFQFGFTSAKTMNQYRELIDKINSLPSGNKNIDPVAITPTVNKSDNIKYYDNYSYFPESTAPTLIKIKAKIRRFLKRLRANNNPNIWIRIAAKS